ncbi:uncharacterized protein LOC143892613 isoform X2 [Tasmannia lanceolata]|uniref:uncharacterized protein LOC143892613 isoform X2 n=1 Tax=Tasmannia lanceolata TaxID=3420 RepID=UPI0040631FFC
MACSYDTIPRDQSHWRERTNDDPLPRCSSQAAFQKNIKDLVRDHLHTCIVFSSNSQISNTNSNSTCENSNSQHGSNGEFWASDEEMNNTTNWSRSISRRQQSRILDRWAARQAREMITTIERQAHEAELQALCNSQPVSAMNSSFLRETSPARSECSVDVPNLRASSLVQMWKELEAEVRQSGNLSSSVNSAVSRMNAMSTNDNASSLDAPSVSSEICDESFTDWESETAPSEPIFSTRVSDVGESERGRVADTIQMLTSGNRTQSSMTSWSDEIGGEQPIVSVREPLQGGENVGFASNGNPLRIRGQQATRNLLLQFEQERQRELARLAERRAVSRFSHRSRIRSLLRFRFLQQEAAVQDQGRPSSTTVELDQLQRGTSILLLRERFSSRGQQSISAATVSDNSRSFPIQFLNNNSLHSEHSSLGEQLPRGQQNSTATTISDNSSNFPMQILNNSPQSDHSSLGEQLTNENNQSQVVCPSDHESETPERQSLLPFTSEDLDWQGAENADESLHDWDVLMEEPEPNSQFNLGDSDGTWVSVVSHPQRAWSDHRRSTYDEWLENNSDNVELRELVERSIVSTTLASNNFRERMERLVLSYLQRQALQPVDEEEEEEEEHLVQQQDHEVSNAIPVASTSSQLPLPSQWLHHQDSHQRSSSIHNMPHHSFEMELIYDLKEDVLRIHQEVSDLRKSIEACMDMQVELQRSIKQEISDAINRSGGAGEPLHYSNWVPMRKGSCCICYEMQVDSLLYRCGHMCTCFKCAHELQWGSGRCPICRAPIVDVVRAYADS